MDLSKRECLYTTNLPLPYTVAHLCTHLSLGVPRLSISLDTAQQYDLFLGIENTVLVVGPFVDGNTGNAWHNE